MNVGYKTGSGNILSLNVLGHFIPRTDIPLIGPKEELHILCGDCKGFSGSCPGAGVVPYFTGIKSAIPMVYVITVQIDAAWAIYYSTHRIAYFVNGYLDRLTELYLKRILRRLREATNLFYLAAGSCAGCTSKSKCSVLAGEKCRNPSKRTFSVEATGINCTELQKLFFGTTLPYWYYGDAILPKTMTRYGLLFSLNNLDRQLLDVVETDTSYTQDSLPIPEYCIETAVIPDGAYDAGWEYLAYNLEDV